MNAVDALLFDVERWARGLNTTQFQLYEKGVRAIEAEAVAAERERIKRGVEGLDEASPDRLRWDGLLSRAAVLRIVEGEEP